MIDQGTEIDCRVQRVAAGIGAFAHFDKLFHEGIMDFRMNDQSRPSRTNLAHVEENTVDRGLNGSFQKLSLQIFTKNLWPFAPALQ